MKAAKHFRWEGAHRLPWHEGACRNLHGHSYRMTVEVEGEPDARGMLVDFKDLKRALQPLVDAWDHATLVADGDDALLDALRSLGSKYAVLPYDSTSENLCRYVADHLGTEALDASMLHRLTMIRVRIQETETSYAEVEVPVEKFEVRRTKVEV